MSRLDTAVRMLVVAAILTTMSVFMHATPLILTALVLGGAMVVLGSLYQYRLGALTGVVIAAICAASSIEIDSVLEVGKLLTAILGLLLPLFLLACYALRTDETGFRIPLVGGRSVAMSLAFALVCILSPFVIGLMSLALPTLMAQVSGIAETGVLLLTAAVGTLLLTRRARTRRSIGRASDEIHEETV